MIALIKKRISLFLLGALSASVVNLGCNQPADRMAAAIEKAAARIAQDQTFYHSALSGSGSLHDPGIRVEVGMAYYVVVRAEGVHAQVAAEATGKEKQ